MVGAPKCGTGAISYFLNQHPEIFLPDRREPNFFSSDLDHRDAASPDEYALLFADRPERMIGESSTWYLYSETAPRRIRDACGPATRIVVVVRNPLELVSSLFDYRRFFATHRIPNLATALRDERTHLEAVARGDEKADPLKIHRAVANFAEGIARYDAAFGRENVHIVFYEDLVRDVRTVLRELYAFLGVDDGFAFEDRRVNQSFGRRLYWLSYMLRWRTDGVNRVVRAMPRGPRQSMLRLIDRLNTRMPRKLPLPVEVKAELQAYFRDGIRLLERRTGRDLSHWYE